MKKREKSSRGRPRIPVRSEAGWGGANPVFGRPKSTHFPSTQSTKSIATRDAPTPGVTSVDVMHLAMLSLPSLLDHVSKVSICSKVAAIAAVAAGVVARVAEGAKCYLVRSFPAITDLAISASLFGPAHSPTSLLIKWTQTMAKTKEPTTGGDKRECDSLQAAISTHQSGDKHRHPPAPQSRPHTASINPPQSGFRALQVLIPSAHHSPHTT